MAVFSVMEKYYQDSNLWNKYNLVDSLAQNCLNWFSIIWETTLPRASLIVIVFGECTTRWEFFFCYYVKNKWNTALEDCI